MTVAPKVEVEAELLRIVARKAQALTDALAGRIELAEVERTLDELRGALNDAEFYRVSGCKNG